MDDLCLAAIYAVWLALSTMPLGFMLGSSCSPCCGGSVGCEVSDGKPRTDPATEGVWTPSGTWRGVGGVTWTYSATPSTTDGGTWFFYGSLSTSKAGGGATTAEQRDWGNICNWYSNKTTSPSSTASLATVLDKRATRLPPSDAIVFVYSAVNTASSGPQTVKTAYFFGGGFGGSPGGTLTTTSAAHDSTHGAVFFSTNNAGTINNGALFFSASATVAAENAGLPSGVVNDGATFEGLNVANLGTVNGGAVFSGNARNDTGTVNGGATFNNDADNRSFGIVNGGAVFNDNSANFATVNGGATFNNTAKNWPTTISSSGEVYDGATFNNLATNRHVVYGGASFFNTAANEGGTVNGGATFNDSSENTFRTAFPTTFVGTVNDGATFNDTSFNRAVVNDGAVFNDNARHSSAASAVVNGGATFNDDACSLRIKAGTTFADCPGANRRRFVAHPTDLPTCNGNAPDGCDNAADDCGCN